MTHKNNSSSSVSGSRGLSPALGLLVLLGAASSAWAQYLWSELVASRSGGTPFCAFGESDCGALWDATFAAAIHTYTGLPVAAWGVAWGWLAFLLPLAALVAVGRGRSATSWAGAIRLVAFAGIAGLVVLLTASAMAGMFCTSCAITYVITILYAAVVWRGLPAGESHELGAGLPSAALFMVAIYLVLLYPGLHTPRNAVREGEKALAAVAESSANSAAVAGGASGSVVDAQLTDLIGSLPPQALQALSDSIFIYQSSPAFALQPPRALSGPADAPVRITEFTDALCSHCATLHGTLEYLRTILPPDSFSVDSRQFPLDGNCNSHLPTQGAESVRCLAARARICFESTPSASQFSGAVYQNQAQLTPELVFAAAAPLMERSELDRCLASPETAQKVMTDVDYAWLYEPDGTPLVLLNGRKASSFGPFLYAMVLTEGRTDHPALAGLPAPNPHAHVH